jgi:exodeoxyribonuclease-3
MRIATWNVNGLRARLGFVVHWLRARRPDVVGLQELKLTEEQFPRAEIEAEGYHAAVYGQKGWNGVAVLSRTEPVLRQRGLPGQEESGARLVTVDVADLSYTTIYVPNGKDVTHADFPRKLAWLDALVAHFRNARDPRRPAVLCGDFNVVPAAIDSWNEARFRGRIFHTDEERTRFRALLESGFVDLFRERHPETAAFSWWDYRGGAFHRKQGLRIDFLLGTAGVLERIRGVEIDREYRKKKDGLTASDHAPVMVDLD